MTEAPSICRDVSKEREPRCEAERGERCEAERQQAQINIRVVQRGYEENLSSHKCCQKEQVVQRGYAISIHGRDDWINP